MNFNFKINKNLLAASLLLGASTKESELTKLQNLMWDKHRDAYELLNNYERRLMFVDSYKKKLASIAEKMEALVNDIIKSGEFMRIYQETLKYRNWLETEWIDKKTEVEEHLKDILKTELPKKDFKVLVIHQTLKGGLYLGDNKILWGHNEDWGNYSIVYLVHEALHAYFDKNEITHALIELATDNELRIRLNRGGEYFTCNGNSIGHGYLKKLEQEILPEWKTYLNNDKKPLNIFDLQKRLEKKELKNP